MKSDVVALQGGGEQPFWVHFFVRDNIPLQVEHFLPSFCLIGLGLIPSIIVFLVEVRHGSLKGRAVDRVPGSNPRQRNATNNRHHDSIRRPEKRYDDSNITEIEIEFI